MRLRRVHSLAERPRWPFCHSASSVGVTGLGSSQLRAHLSNANIICRSLSSVKESCPNQEVELELNSC